MAAVVVLAAWSRLPPVLAAAVLAATIVGLGFSLAATLRQQAAQQHPLLRQAGQDVEVSVRVVEQPRSLGGTGRVLMHAELCAMGTPARPVSGKVVVFGPASSLRAVDIGQTLHVHAMVARPTRRDLTVATLTITGPVNTSEGPRIYRAANAVRQRFVDEARASLPPAQAALLPALVLGDTSALDSFTTAAFRDSGLTHLMAVSGANVSIVCGAVLLLRRVTGPRIAVVIAAAVLTGFVVLVGPSPSVLRAAGMGAVGLLGLLTSRRSQAIPALAATILVLLSISPALAVDIGFALSVVATCALVLLAPRWSACLEARGWPQPLADAVAIAVAAQLVTAPLIAAISGRFSLAAVAANLVAGVVVAPITVLGIVAVAVAPFSHTAATILVRFCGPELWWLLGVADCAAAGGRTTIPVPSGFMGFAVICAVVLGAALCWRKPWFRCLLAITALGVVAQAISTSLINQ